MLLINNRQVKTPSAMRVTRSTFDSAESGRNSAGDMVRDVVTVKESIELKFPPMNDSEIQNILRLIEPPFFDVTYISPFHGTTTRRMYVGDRTAPVYSWNSRFRDMRWEELSFNLIER